MPDMPQQAEALVDRRFWYTLCDRSELSELGLMQCSEHFSQPLRRHIIYTRNHISQSINHCAKGARKFVGIDSPDERVLELRRHLAR